jgi:hypothetical protein
MTVDDLTQQIEETERLIAVYGKADENLKPSFDRANSVLYVRFTGG